MPQEPSQSTTDWTIARLLAWTTEHLTAHGVGEPRLSAEILLAQAIGCQRIELYTQFQGVPNPEALAAFRELVRRAANHTPIAYLVSRKEFYSLTFEVTPDVLIPRPETETLVTHAIEIGRQATDPALHMLDVATGSGCIVIAALKHLPDAHAVATDVSSPALTVANRNAESHAVADRILFVNADGLSLDTAVVPAGGFDMLLCNPPYVAETDLATLPISVRDHEPRIALTPGGDGLDFFRTLAANAQDVLKPGASLLVEIGMGQRNPVARIFAERGGFEHVGTYRDSPDPHDRVMHFQKDR